MTPLAVPESQAAAKTRGLGYVARAARSAAFGAWFGLAIAFVRGQSVGVTLIYSLCISLICWFCIDLGRTAVAALLRRRGGAAARREWPGWPWMVFLVFVGSTIGYGLGTALGDRITGARSLNLFDGGGLHESVTLLLWALLPAVGLTFYFYSHGELIERRAAEQAALRQAAETRLKLLESQLEPHMLFNTLANLRVLITLDPPRAQLMLDRLIGFLRATLGASRTRRHSLQAEFARLADYLSLLQVRMADRLQVSFELPAALEGVAVPPLLLQPLVENSVIHGLEPAIAGGRIDISAAREGDELVLCVRDTGTGCDLPPGDIQPGGASIGDADAGGAEGETSAFGLAQVRERLATLYGARASLRLSPGPDAQGGTLAVIRLPLGEP